jgi:hypothetical protein
MRLRASYVKFCVRFPSRQFWILITFPLFALPYLRQVAAEPASTDDLRSLRLQVLDALQRLESRLPK